MQRGHEGPFQHQACTFFNATGMLAYMATEFGGRGGHERLGLGASFDRAGLLSSSLPPGRNGGSNGWNSTVQQGNNNNTNNVDDVGSACRTPPPSSTGNSFDGPEGSGTGRLSQDGDGNSLDAVGSVEGDQVRGAARLLRRRSSDEVSYR
jgi:hypothetical protein